MKIRLTNTLGGGKEEFEPLEAGKVRMYSCGPTVKEPTNLAKFRSYLLADVARRTFALAGYETRHVMNITDVGHLNEFEEDVVEITAARKGVPAGELVAKQEKLFHEDRRGLHIRDADVYPHAQAHIDDMIAVIRELEAKGMTYQAGGNVYLDVERADGLGRLAGKTMDELVELQRSFRVQPHAGKRHPLDIDLWRTDVVHQAHWKSPWGRGFPGWHVECVAMSRKYLGEAFDVHTGGHDNIFPHHECEIAQASALSGKLLARYWLHSGPVNSDGKPMTLQNRNVVTARDLLGAGIRGSVLRVALLLPPYRAEIDFGEPLLAEARTRVNAILGFHEYLTLASAATRKDSAAPSWIEETDAAFRDALADDLDYRTAIDHVVRRIDQLEPDTIGNPREALKTLARWDSVLGVVG